jgi:peptide/nickel transport system substrate-binding protein
MRGIGITVLAVMLMAGAARAETMLRIGLADDADALDPTLARTFVGRIVFASLCDKLFDIGPKLEILPQLATSYSWSEDHKALTIALRPGVLFHDGETMDAAAVKYSIERHLRLPGSNRKGEISAVTSVAVVDDHTVRLDLATPFTPLLAQLTDRAGMIVSPKAAEAAGDKFSAHPVCAGPFKFTERVAQGRIVLDRFDRYWDKDKIHVDRVVFQPIPDAAVRLADLQSGGLDLIERVSPSDVAEIAGKANLATAEITELGYQTITLNVAKGSGCARRSIWPSTARRSTRSPSTANTSRAINGSRRRTRSTTKPIRCRSAISPGRSSWSRRPAGRRSASISWCPMSRCRCRWRRCCRR